MDGSKRRLERLACDRCHRQKLRCSRASNHGRACQRCVKAGQRCTYSPPLRLGRPASGSKPAGQASRPWPACKSNDEHRGHQVSPLTPMTTPPSMTLARHNHDDAVESLANLSRPPTPPACSDASPGFDACGGGQSSSRPPEAAGLLTCSPDRCLATARMTPLSASPTFMAMPEPLSSDSAVLGPADYLMTPASATGLDAGPDDAFMMADLDEYPYDGSLAASMLLDMCSEQPLPAATSCDFDEFCLYTTDPCPPVMDTPRIDDGTERQLLALQQSLFEAPCASVMVDEVGGLQRTIDLTTRASNVLLGIIMALMSPDSARPSLSPRSSSPSSSSPPPDGSRRASSGSGTTTILLVTACYARVLRNVDAIATRLHDMVSSSDQAALLALLPCVHIGSLMPATLVAPAIQASVLVQLLSQSLREMEKRLPLLARAVLDQPLAPASTGRGLSSATGGRRSHIADMVGAVNSEVAGLETHVTKVLSVTMDLLSHSGGFMYDTME